MLAEVPKDKEGRIQPNGKEHKRKNESGLKALRGSCLRFTTACYHTQLRCFSYQCALTIICTDDCYFPSTVIENITGKSYQLTFGVLPALLKFFFD